MIDRHDPPLPRPPPPPPSPIVRESGTPPPARIIRPTSESIKDRWRHFTLDEFTCRCGCGRIDMNLVFIDRLDELRERVGFALIVTSGFRCPEHNVAVSTTGPDGPHTTGEASDVAVSRHLAWKLLEGAFAMGFSGIGVHQRGGDRFVHLDTLLEPAHAPRPSVWSY